jgi:hypothetical protein
MKTGINALFVAVIMLMLCLPLTAFANPHHSHGGRNHGNHHGHGNHGYQYVQQCGLTDSQFAYFAESVREAFFESDRMDLVRTAAASNSFTASQVIQIMNIMDFESYKIEAAAAMYHSLCDYSEWYLVYSALTYSSSSEELNRMIGL